MVDIGIMGMRVGHSRMSVRVAVRLSGRIAWLFWAAAYLVKMVGFRKQMEVAIDHVTHVFFEHDSSQILNRRQVLSDEELNLSLVSSNGESPAADRVAPSSGTVTSSRIAS